MFLTCAASLAEPPHSAPVPEPFTRQAYLMGTMLNITIFEADEAKALRVSEQIVNSVEETENQLSTWRPTSELSRINAQPIGRPFPMSASLCVLMQRLQAQVRQTEGAFDPGLGRILQAWGIHQDVKIPTKDALKDALRNSGFACYTIDANICEIKKARDCLLDAGAFGKGEALDRVLALASAENFPPFLLDFGGQIAAWKNPPSGGRWGARIADPEDRAGLSTIQVQFASGSISTSGQSEQETRAHGIMIGHIVDPRTGQPANWGGSVTVWNESALQADILSTALFVMGPEKGLKWAESHHAAACFLSRKKVKMSSKAYKIMTIIIDTQIGSCHRSSSSF